MPPSAHSKLPCARIYIGIERGFNPTFLGGEAGHATVISFDSAVTNL
jgi:hypothetical protein